MEDSKDVSIGKFHKLDKEENKEPCFVERFAVVFLDWLCLAAAFSLDQAVFLLLVLGIHNNEPWPFPEGAYVGETCLKTP